MGRAHIKMDTPEVILLKLEKFCKKLLSEEWSERIDQEIFVAHLSSMVALLYHITVRLDYLCQASDMGIVSKIHLKGKSDGRRT